VLPNWERSVLNGAKRRQGRFTRDRVCVLKLLSMNRFTCDSERRERGGKQGLASGNGDREPYEVHFVGVV
jgi:hypothetical protein